MTRRRQGWTRVAAVGVFVSTGAPIGWPLTRPALTPGAGVVESLADTTPASAIDDGLREDIASYTDNIAVPAVPEPVR
jgi:hypothetical protein